MLELHSHSAWQCCQCCSCSKKPGAALKHPSIEKAIRAARCLVRQFKKIELASKQSTWIWNSGACWRAFNSSQAFVPLWQKYIISNISPLIKRAIEIHPESYIWVSITAGITIYIWKAMERRLKKLATKWFMQQPLTQSLFHLKKSYMSKLKCKQWHLQKKVRWMCSSKAVAPILQVLNQNLLQPSLVLRRRWRQSKESRWCSKPGGKLSPHTLWRKKHS